MNKSGETAPALAGEGGGKDRHAHSTRPEPLLIGSPAAARMLSLSPRTLWSLTRDGALPHRRVGARVLYSVDELRAWVAAGCPSEGGAA